MDVIKKLRSWANTRRYPDLWLGRDFPLDAYVSFIHHDNGRAALIIKKPSGQVWIDLEAHDLLTSLE